MLETIKNALVTIFAYLVTAGTIYGIFYIHVTLFGAFGAIQAFFVVVLCAAILWLLSN